MPKSTSRPILRLIIVITILPILALIIFFVFVLWTNSKSKIYFYTPPNPEVHMPLQLSNHLRSESSVPPPGWKEYEEPNGNFSIWYPDNWQANGKDMEVTITPLNVDDSLFQPSLKVNIYVAQFQDSCRKEFAHKTTFLGLPASYEGDPDDGFYGGWHVYTDKKYYGVSYSVPWVRFNGPFQDVAPPHFSLAIMLNDRKILEKIISSFKPKNYKYIIPCNQM